jgi:hypothetical protein
MDTHTPTNILSQSDLDDIKINKHLVLRCMSLIREITLTLYIAKTAREFVYGASPLRSETITYAMDHDPNKARYTVVRKHQRLEDTYPLTYQLEGVTAFPLQCRMLPGKFIVTFLTRHEAVPTTNGRLRDGVNVEIRLNTTSNPLTCVPWDFETQSFHESSWLRGQELDDEYVPREPHVNETMIRLYQMIEEQWERVLAGTAAE